MDPSPPRRDPRARSDDPRARSELRRRRDELAEQVAELHWDLGGLTYEMAIRDHFRLDLLVRHAAVLQGQRERRLLFCLRGAAQPWGSVLLAVWRDADGARPQLGRARGSGGARRGHAGHGSGERIRGVVSRLDFALPPPWARGVLVLVFLGFGILVGNVTSNSGVAQGASAQRRLRLVLPPAAPTSSQGASTSPASSAPPVSSESTPQPASTAPATAQGGTAGTPTTTSNGSGSHGTQQGSGGGKSGSTSGGAQGSGGGESGSAGGGEGGGSTAKPAVKHVFLIVLADQPYAAVFGPASKAPYLAQSLERRGELLVRYYAVAHDELANAVALVSGQGPTTQTAANCPTFAGIAPAKTGAEGQVEGQGCVYPSSTQTLAGQLTAKHLTWRAYVEGMSGSCVHPTTGAADVTVGAAPPAPSTAGTADQATPANQAAAGEEYTTFRNPFVYFSSIIGSPTACAADDVGLGQLSTDLKSAKSTPTLSYIVPSLCDDGSPMPCAPGKPAGLAPADAFLQEVVPRIMASPAYKKGGLLAITVDQAPATGVEADSSSCCGQPRFPNLPASAPLPSGQQLPPSGGGQVGALLLSPFVKAGTTNQEPYNHFSLLRTIEDLFGLGHLGYGGAAKTSPFGASVFDG
jgi:phosphatidylinositol-3-phosphatase